MHLGLLMRDVDDSDTLPPFVRPLYFTFLLLGAALLVVLVITLALVRPLHRTATLLNLCLAWIVLPLMMSFLLFSGDMSGNEPSFNVCLTSASFALAAAPLGGFAAFSMIMQIFLLVVHPIQMGNNEQWVTLVLVALPWIVGITYLLATVGMGLAHRDLVMRSKLYCIVNDERILATSSGLILIAMILSVLLIATIVFKVWRSPLRKTRGCTMLDRLLCVRLLVFGLYVLFAIIAGIVSFWNYTSLVPDMVISTIPLAIFCIFASQRDVLTAWRLRSPTHATPHRTHPGDSAHPHQTAQTTPRSSRTMSVLEGDAPMPRTQPPPTLVSEEKELVSSESTLASSSVVSPEETLKVPISKEETEPETELDVVDDLGYEPPRRRDPDVEQGRRPSFTRRPDDDRFVPRL
ncbi:hypothetical protein CALVIDRAFT_596323 [Calocera viscosa TUFC12733]|uniref:G-protein coupled receptors family 2 profile 2 domain-containing protein n=1 Tax=Calocera viscosa (strain TUFC12733) TaxID=1330018 RepID=A0A167PY53_CALVF|nr:hypothetical protein CALVIDRAFT_596323 [Calocera viscosa TUFC12733]